MLSSVPNSSAKSKLNVLAVELQSLFCWSLKVVTRPASETVVVNPLTETPPKDLGSLILACLILAKVEEQDDSFLLGLRAPSSLPLSCLIGAPLPYSSLILPQSVLKTHVVIKEEEMAQWKKKNDIIGQDRRNKNQEKSSDTITSSQIHIWRMQIERL